MVRYKVVYWDDSEKEERTYKGWANGSTFAEGAQVIEKYYGGDNILNMTIALYENYDDELIEEGYFEGFGSDQEDI